MKLQPRPEVVARINERNKCMSEAIARGESDIVPDRPLTETERRAAEVVAGDDEDADARKDDG